MRPYHRIGLALLMLAGCVAPGAQRRAYHGAQPPYHGYDAIAPAAGPAQPPQSHFPSRYTPHDPEYYWQDRLGQCAFPAQIPPTVIWCRNGS